jgi:large subunit ribosomal protein L16
MPLMPKRVKYRKVQRRRNFRNATANTELAFGDYGLKALEAGYLTSQQLEAARTSVTRHLQRRGKLWIKVFPDRPYTKKPLETRQGKGKGPVEGWHADIRPGNIILELGGVTRTLAQGAMARAANKLPIRCKFIARESE